MSRCLQFSSSLNVSRWPYWFYTRCLRCSYEQRVGVGYARGPDPVTFDPEDQCSYYYRLLDTHAGAVGNQKNFLQLRQCKKCSKIHGDWEYLTDHEFVEGKVKALRHSSLPDSSSKKNASRSPQRELSDLEHFSQSTYAMKPVNDDD